jgi:FixJ family two-component response regulator
MGFSNAVSRNGGVRRDATVSLIGVIDDDESVRDALGSLLRSAGYKCEVFPSAEAFLESGRIAVTECVVLDIQMPGLNGFELHLKLRQMRCSLPVIFVTGQGDEELRARALKNGAIALLRKPFSDEALLGAIQSAIG